MNTLILAIKRGYSLTLRSSISHRALSHTSKDPSDDSKIEEDSDPIYDREFVDLNLEKYESLFKYDLTGDIKAKIQTILNEYEYMKYNSMGRVPSDIDIHDMNRLLNEGPTPGARDKLITFLYKREMMKRTNKNRKERDRREMKIYREEKLAMYHERYGGKRTGLLSEKGDLIYGLWHNTLFCRIPDNKLKSGRSASRLVDAALFGRRLIFDFEFDQQMTPWICRNTMEQVQEAYGLNRYHYKEPFDLWFCNFKKDSDGARFMINNALRNLYDGSMITVKSDCFTNHFDKSKLVYLSPNAAERLDDINKTDDVYIIGAYNDKSGSKPLTYRKAEALGIRSRRLPIDDHISIAQGTKSLCLNHVTGILLEMMANGGDWYKAMTKYIPQRKIKPLDVVLEEEKRRREKMHKRSRVKFSIKRDLDFS